MARGEGRDPDRLSVPLYIAFAESVRDAERQCEAAIAIMATAKIKTTADALAFLARRFGGEWREKTELTIDLRTAVAALTSDEGEREAALAEAERILAGR
jgi:CRP-like cAMP-binding protein